MILFLAIIVFFFTLYIFSKEDFILMRKNISLVTIFNIAILSSFFGIVISRLLFALSHPSFAYFNPLVFFVIPYFPGLSGIGFFIGFFISAYILLMKQKLPVGRINDIFSFSLLPSVIVFFVGCGVGYMLHKQFIFGLLEVGFIFLLCIIFLFLQKIFIHSSWRDGSFSFPILALITVVFFAHQVIVSHFATPSEWPFFLCMGVALITSFLVRNMRKGEHHV